MSSSERTLQALSYAVAFCGFLTLLVSGTFGIAASALYLAAMATAWRIEGTNWQISERAGTVMIVLALPLFYLAWRIQVFPVHGVDNAVAGMLARMILVLSGIKLLQRKKDRDWVFLHLMTFFAVLLAAGLSISPLYLASFILYILVVVAAIVVWENVSSARRTLERKGTHEPQRADRQSWTRLANVSFIIVALTISLAVPLFFVLPRVGGAGFGGSGGGVSTYSGFSDSVRLGGIGKIQQSDRVVMRVETSPSKLAGSDGYYRGVALDRFDNLSWSKSRTQNRETLLAGADGSILIENAKPFAQLVRQNIYLEPIDTPVLFGQTRVVEVASGFSALYRDSYDSLVYPRTGERISYTVVSDISRLTAEQLQADRQPYGHDVERYLELPASYDKRIFSLAQSVTTNAVNRYDKAIAVRDYLRANFGYTLEMKAGGDEPLADFLFNVREGHCEYFATAMAVMLRTQGVATRVVNGFHGGDYNSASGVTVVRELNAHSWVEVYFPDENAWVPFDPTPFSGQTAGGSAVGITAAFGKYLEALETFWIQYFVAFDNQEQRSLFTSVRRGFSDYQSKTSGFMEGVGESLSEWWKEVRGEKGIETSLAAVGRGIIILLSVVLGVFLVVWLYRKIVKLKVWQRLWNRALGNSNAAIVEFYQRMLTVLAEKGYVREPHQTPLEFAYTVGTPEAVMITQAYNEVRFGSKRLSGDEENRIESWLKDVRLRDRNE